MSGKVSFVSRNGGMIVVSHDRGHTIVELLGNEGDIEVGDAVYGDWLALGGEPIKRAGESDPFDAYYQGCWPTIEGAVLVARNTGGG